MVWLNVKGADTVTGLSFEYAATTGLRGEAVVRETRAHGIDVGGFGKHGDVRP